MGILLFFLTIGIYVLWAVVSALQPKQPELRNAELRRRIKDSSTYALELDRSELLPAVNAALRALAAFVGVLFVIAAIGTAGWFWGVCLALIGAVLLPLIVRFAPVQKAAQKLYGRWESWLLDQAVKFEKTLLLFRHPRDTAHEHGLKVNSREELEELIAASPDVIGPDERKLLAAALSFHGKTVAGVMTPRTAIDSIQKDEFLGPKVLDELHSYGHSRLPVIDEDLDHVVGVLHMRDMLSLAVRESTTAEHAMEKKVYYIHQDDTLEHALAAFLRTRHHLFIVINEFRETVGLVSLEDVMEALIGRKIVDEDDIHADIRQVAAKSARQHNSAPGHVDL